MEGLCGGGALRISPVFLDEVGLQGCNDFVGRLQRVVDGPVPCSVVKPWSQYRARLTRVRSLESSPATRPPGIRRTHGMGRRLLAMTRN